MSATPYSFTVTAQQVNLRADKLLSELLPEVSRSYLKQLFDANEVLVFGKPVKASRQLKEGEVISLTLPEPVSMEAHPEDIPLDILYEDEDVLVVNKPKGMVVHPAAGHYEGTLVNAVLHHCGENLSGINGVLRPGIVHRIDKDTTGSVLVCKNDAAHQSLAAQLKAHTIDRVYHAIVCGIVKEEKGCVNAPIGRSAKDRKKMAVMNARDVAKGRGKEAVTHYAVLKRFYHDNLTSITCKLETGRTHQIRVHMAHIGHPLLGDGVYGGRQKLSRVSQGDGY
ncbi:MAG: RluA family pseudouridine synthase, partial [Lachnospiraceae bacterium]|nr:RluA family pseudouridine synthase [Lachnospiraceae bacterium]